MGHRLPLVLGLHAQRAASGAWTSTSSALGDGGVPQGQGAACLVDQWINSGSIVDRQLEVAVQVPYQIY